MPEETVGVVLESDAIEDVLRGYVICVVEAGGTIS